MPNATKPEPRVARELERLRVEQAEHADAERRSLSYTLQIFVAHIAFAFAPRVPGAHVLFGQLEAPLALAFVAPSLLLGWLSRWFYLRGGATRSYVIAEMFETFANYGIQMAFIWVSRLPWSVFWVLCPFAAAFFAQTKPFRQRFYAIVIVVEHTTMAVALAIAGRPMLPNLVIGAVTLGMLVLLSQQRRGEVRLEAERNVLKATLAETRLDRERDRIGRALQDGIGEEIAALVQQLDTPPPLLDDLARIVRPAADDRAVSLAELARLITDKCNELAADVARDHSLGDSHRDIPPNAARALLRVAQELFRNAIVHGGATRVTVALSQTADTTMLTVQDDGVGLSAASFAGASGGLANARVWLGELGGSLACDPPADGRRGTRMRARLPTGS